MNTKSLALLAVLALCGCGGSGGVATPNPFAGTWAGPLDASTGVNETVSFTVATNGNLSGTDAPVGGGTAGSDVGTVDTSGNFSVTATVTGSPSAHSTGVMSINGSGLLIGNGTTTQGSQQAIFTFSLTKQ